MTSRETPEDALARELSEELCIQARCSNRLFWRSTWRRLGQRSVTHWVRGQPTEPALASLLRARDHQRQVPADKMEKVAFATAVSTKRGKHLVMLLYCVSEWGGEPRGAEDQGLLWVAASALAGIEFTDMHKSLAELALGFLDTVRLALTSLRCPPPARSLVPHAPLSALRGWCVFLTPSLLRRLRCNTRPAAGAAETITGRRSRPRPGKQRHRRERLGARGGGAVAPCGDRSSGQQRGRLKRLDGAGELWLPAADCRIHHFFCTLSAFRPSRLRQAALEPIPPWRIPTTRLRGPLSGSRTPRLQCPRSPQAGGPLGDQRKRGAGRRR